MIQRFVVDTNVLVSRLLSPNSIPANAVTLAVTSGVLLFSEETFQELEIVLGRKKFDSYVSLQNRRAFVQFLKEISQVIKIIESIQVCRDTKDNKFLEVAVSGQAKMLITGDADLLSLNPFRSIEIVNPNEFLNKLS